MYEAHKDSWDMTDALEAKERKTEPDKHTKYCNDRDKS